MPTVEEVWRTEGDRLVAGPELIREEPKTPARANLLARLLVVPFALLLLGAGFVLGGGLAPEPTWQTAVQARIVEGCLPQVLVVGVGTLAETDKMADGNNTAVSAIRAQYPDARSIESHLVPAQGLKLKNPQAEQVAFVTLERCL